MKEPNDDYLPPEAELALAWSPPKVRAALTTVLQLDRRLARIVARTSEPMLGQMRLAWWREALAKPTADRPQGDKVLDALGRHWAGKEQAVIAMVEGWEYLLADRSLAQADLQGCAAGRAAPFSALIDNRDETLDERIRMAGMRYALADLAANLCDQGERETAIAYGLGGSCPSVPLPRELRGLAVLEALALRSLRRGGRPLMEGRGAPFAALRAAIFRT
jgi:phytoene synthase